jgi:lysozyme
MRYTIFLFCALSITIQAKNPLTKLRRHTYVKSFLDVIAYIEGTDRLHGYKTLFTGETFNDYQNHPNKTICAFSSKKMICSAAAGRYSLEYGMWRQMAKKMKAYNFGPVNQDCAMIQILYEVGALGDIKKGNIIQASKKLGKIKKSFADIAQGVSPFRFEDVEMKFYQALVTHRNTDRGIHHLDPLRGELKDAHVRAFLDMISYAEGTSGKNGYYTCFTGKRIKSLAVHPGNVICAVYSGSKLCSTATGRYQFLKRTWDSVAEKIAAFTFSAIEQDRGAVYLLHEQRALHDIKNNRFEAAVKKVKNIWASMPGSSFGQPLKKMNDLKKKYYEALFVQSKKSK